MNLEIGDKVSLTINGQVHISTIKSKKGIFFKLEKKHPLDCCNLISKERLVFISR